MGDNCSPDNLLAKLNGVLGSEGLDLPAASGFEPRNLQQRFHFEKQMIQPEKMLKEQMEELGLPFETSPNYAEISKTFDERIDDLAKKSSINKPETVKRVNTEDTPKVARGKVVETARVIATAMGDYVIGGRSASVAKGIKDAAKLKLDVDPESKLWMNRETTAPNRIFGEKVFEPVAEEIRELHKRYGAFTSPDFQKNYRDTVAKIVKAERENLENIVRFSDSIEELGDAVKTRYGIQRERIYDLHSWLSSLESPFQRPKQGSAENILEYMTDSFAKRTAVAKPTWWLFNIGDASRVVSDYIGRPKGTKAVMEGLADTFGGRGLTGAFTQDPNLQQKGVYDLSRDLAADLVRDDNNLFAWTNNMQLNLAYNIGQRYNGKGLEAMQNSAFHHEWFNQPKMMRDFSSPFSQKLVFGLMRYMINENIWYFNQSRWMFSNDKDVQKSAITSMLGYSLARATLFGAAGVIPAPIFPFLESGYKQIMGQDLSEDLRELDRNIPTNLLGKGLTEGANLVGRAAGFRDVGEYEINLGEAIQPLGGGFLVRARQLGDTVNAGVRHFQSAFEDGLSGNIPAAMADGLAAALTGMMLLDFGPLAAVNDLSARAARNTARELRGDGNYTKAILDTIAGSYNVKKAPPQ